MGFNNRFRIIKLQEIVIKIRNRIIVQSFNTILRIDIHYEVRKKVHRKLLVFNQEYYEVMIYGNVSTQTKVSSFLNMKNYCEQPSFHIGIRLTPLPRRFHEEHNNTY